MVKVYFFSKINTRKKTIDKIYIFLKKIGLIFQIFMNTLHIFNIISELICFSIKILEIYSFYKNINLFSLFLNYKFYHLYHFLNLSNLK